MRMRPTVQVLPIATTIQKSQCRPSTYLYEQHIRLPMVHEISLPIPILQRPVLIIVVVKCPHGRKYVVWKSALPKTEGGESPLHLKVTIPFIILGTFDATGVVVRGVDARGQRSDRPNALELHCVPHENLPSVNILELECMTQERPDEIGFLFAPLEKSVIMSRTLRFYPYNSDGRLPIGFVVVDEPEVHLLAGVQKPPPESTLMRAAVELFIGHNGVNDGSVGPSADAARHASSDVYLVPTRNRGLAQTIPVREERRPGLSCHGVDLMPVRYVIERTLEG